MLLQKTLLPTFFAFNATCAALSGKGTSIPIQKPAVILDNLVKNNNQDKKKRVILHTFPTIPHAYSISPFGIKVESYLRIKNIPYEVVHTNQMGPNGQIPYIHLLNESEAGDDINPTVEVIPDSNIIIERLDSEFPSSLPESLSPVESAAAHAFTRMLEEHTSQIAFYYRYSLNMEDFMTVVDMRNRVFSANNSPAGAAMAEGFARILPKDFSERMKARRLLRHSDERLWEFSFRDLKALSDYTGEDKPYFHGNRPTAFDCTVFGHLSQIMYINLSEPFPQQVFIKEHCDNLVRFMERFKNEYWPDWDQKCMGKAD